MRMFVYVCTCVCMHVYVFAYNKDWLHDIAEEPWQRTCKKNQNIFFEEIVRNTLPILTKTRSTVFQFPSLEHRLKKTMTKS